MYVTNNKSSGPCYRFAVWAQYLDIANQSDISELAVFGNVKLG